VDSYPGWIYVASTSSEGWGSASITDRIPMGFYGFDDILNSQLLIATFRVGDLGYGDVFLPAGGTVGLKIVEFGCGAICSGNEQALTVSGAWLVFEEQPAVPEPASLFMLSTSCAVAVARHCWKRGADASSVSTP
jgi:hypothetical protein